MNNEQQQQKVSVTEMVSSLNSEFRLATDSLRGTTHTAIQSISTTFSNMVNIIRSLEENAVNTNNENTKIKKDFDALKEENANLKKDLEDLKKEYGADLVKLKEEHETILSGIREELMDARAQIPMPVPVFEPAIAEAPVVEEAI